MPRSKTAGSATVPAPTRTSKAKPAVSALSAAVMAKLATSGLDAVDARAMQLSMVTAEQAQQMGLPSATPGFKLPYFDLKGNVDPAICRVRYLEDTRQGFDKLLGKSALRYGQPAGTPPGVYLPPNGGLNWEEVAQDAETALVITEGELKSACAVKHGIPCLGLGGVWSFQSKKQGHLLLPVLQQFAWKERNVYIVFDSDAATNPDVAAAEMRLAQRLVELGAVVFVGRIPGAPPDDAGKAAKMGLDDYVVAFGVQMFKDRVLAEAFHAETSRVLHDLNRRLLYVRDPGFIWDRELDMRVSPDAFKSHAFANVFIVSKTMDKSGNDVVKKEPAAKAWLEWPHRAEALRQTFLPGQPRVTQDALLNTWTGWGVPEPKKGNVEPWERLMLQIFNKDKVERKWFEQWLAYPLQYPGTKLHTAAAIWGVTHGSGKTLIGHTMLRIYGKHAAELKDTDIEAADFAWAESKQFVLADDITAKGDRKLMRRLMTMVTQKFVNINIKYVAKFSLPDYINYYYTSNEPDALYLEDHDRRFWVYETRAGVMDWGEEYAAWMDSDDGIAALWWYLLHIDLAGFNPKAPAPMTQAKTQMTELGKSSLGAWVRLLRDNPDAVLGNSGLKGDLFTAKELYVLYDATGDKNASPNALAREMRRAGMAPPGKGAPLRRKDGTMVNVYVVRNAALWAEASWRAACEHYDENHKHLAQYKKGERKF